MADKFDEARTKHRQKVQRLVEGPLPSTPMDQAGMWTGPITSAAFLSTASYDYGWNANVVGRWNRVHQEGPVAAEERRLRREAESEASRQRMVAEERAYKLLEEAIGVRGALELKSGGFYVVPSKIWPDVIYQIPKNNFDRIKVLRGGSVVTESCLVTTDSSLPWPDLALQRIKAVQADEATVFGVGVLHDRDTSPVMRRFRAFFKRRDA